jgi:hypothetical protein
MKLAADVPKCQEFNERLQYQPLRQNNNSCFCRQRGLTTLSADYQMTAIRQPMSWENAARLGVSGWPPAFSNNPA